MGFTEGLHIGKCVVDLFIVRINNYGYKNKEKRKMYHRATQL